MVAEIKNYSKMSFEQANNFHSNQNNFQISWNNNQLFMHLRISILYYYRLDPKPCTNENPTHIRVVGSISVTATDLSPATFSILLPEFLGAPLS